MCSGNTSAGTCIHVRLKKLERSYISIIPHGLTLESLNHQPRFFYLIQISKYICHSVYLNKIFDATDLTCLCFSSAPPRKYIIYFLFYTFIGNRIFVWFPIICPIRFLLKSLEVSGLSWKHPETVKKLWCYMFKIPIFFIHLRSQVLWENKSKSKIQWCLYSLVWDK